MPDIVPDRQMGTKDFGYNDRQKEQSFYSRVCSWNEYWNLPVDYGVFFNFDK